MRDAPDHMKAGFDYNREMREIEAELIAEGMDRLAFGFRFVAAHRYVERHKDDATLRERQEMQRRPATSGTTVSLTSHEIAYILQRLAGCNDPAGISAAEKLSDATNRIVRVRMEFGGKA